MTKKKIKVGNACPRCTGKIIIRHNKWTNYDFYTCDIPSCEFTANIPESKEKD